MDAVILDPELAPAFEAMPPLVLSPDALLELRAASTQAYADLRASLPADVVRADRVVSDDPLVHVRVHRPVAASGPLPCLFHIHGGGYVMGSLDMDDARFARYCVELGCVGVSVEYRLAPETPYPGPLEDCYAALRWTHEHAAELGIDAARIGVGGISAGGGLAAALALLARDRGELPVAFQLLECPMLDDRQVTSSSRLDGLPVWSRESNEFGWRAYLGPLYGTDDVPGHAAPARADDLGGLPPALVIVGGADGFRDEDVTYAQRLMQAGVPTELHVLPGAPHGVQMFAGTTVVQRWEHLVSEWLRLRLAG